MKANILSRLMNPKALLILAAFIFMGDLFIGGRTFLARDAMSDFIPMRMFESKAILSGEMPFWNPYWGGGKSFVADATSQAFYPPNGLFLIFNPRMAMNLYWLFHICVGGLGVYFLSRQFRCGREASTFAAMSFMLGTWLVSWLEFPYNGAVGAWVPWIFGLVVRFHNNMDARRISPFAEIWAQRRLVCLAAIVFALQFFGNFPEMIIYPFAGYALYMIGAGVAAKSARPSLAMLAFFAASGALALLVTLPQLLPMWELIPYSERAATFDQRFDMASITPSHLLTAVFPFMGGFPGYPAAHWTKGLFEFWVGTFYLGTTLLLAMPFGLYAFFCKEEKSNVSRRIIIVTACIMIFIGLILAFGDNTPVYPWLYKHVPMMNKFRFPAKFLSLVVIGGTLLGAAGMDVVLRKARGASGGVSPAKPVRWLLVVEGAIVLMLGVLAFVFWKNPALMQAFAGAPQMHVAPDMLAKAGLFALISWGFLLLAYAWLLVAMTSRLNYKIILAGAFVIIFANMAVISRQLYPAARPPGLQDPPQVAATLDHRAFSPYSGVQQYLYSDPRPAVYEWAKNAGVGGMWLPYNISQYYQAGTKLLKYNNLTGLIYTDAQHQAELLDMAGVRWVVTGGPWEQILWAQGDSTLRVMERPTANPRLMFARTWDQAPNADAVFSVLQRYGYMLPRHALVESSALWGGSAVSRDVPPAPGTPVLAEVLEHSGVNNRITVQTRAADDALLVFNDTWYPGWRARIDGVETPIYRTNYMFMSVMAPKGDHTVEFVFTPRHFYLYLAISLVTLLAIVLVFVTTRSANKS